MYVGVDIGGTKIELCRFSTDYTLLHAERIPTDSISPGSEVFRHKLLERICEFVKPSDRGLAIATKGIVYQGTVLYSSLMGGEVRYPLQQELERTLGIQVVVDNDIRPLAIAEHRKGRAQGCEHFVVVNLGTGLGIVSYEQGIRSGNRGTAGQVDLLSCWVHELKRMETVQNIVSGGGIESLYRELSGDAAHAAAIFERATRGEEKAQRTRGIFLDVLVRFLGDLSYFYNPELIILSGSLTISLNSFLPEIVSRYEQQVDVFSRAREIAISDLSNANCLGAVLNLAIQ